MATDLWPKRLELLKEIFPKLSRAALFWNKSNAGMAIEAKATQEAAGLMGVTLLDRGVKDPNEIEWVLDATSKDRPDGFPLMDLQLRSHEKRIIEFLTQNRLPAIFENQEMVEAGGLISYGPNYDEVYKRAAVYVDRYSERRETRRSASRAANEIRPDHQSESRQANRPHDTAQRAGEGGSSH